VKATPTQSKKPKYKRGVPVPIPKELYQLLANHASDFSKKLGFKVSVDRLANATLKYGLDHPELIEKAIGEYKQKQKEALQICP